MLGRRGVKIRRGGESCGITPEAAGVHECAAEGVQLVVGLIGSGGAVTEPDESEESFRIQVGVSCPHGCTI